MNKKSYTPQATSKALRAVVLVSSLMLAVVPTTAPRAQTPAKPDAEKPVQKPAEKPADAAAQANVVALKALPAKGKRYALIIGVDKYADTQITTLGGASNDAKALAGALVAYAGFPADQVILLASDQPAERQPTRGNILRRLSNLATDFPKDGLLLFSFAGHGMERGGQAFLLPSDAQVSDDVSLLEQTAVNVQTVKDWVKKSGVRQVLLLLDACRNDPGGRADADNPLTETYTQGLNFSTRNREVEA
ncbi:MAG TPA: caspase family protein, partial [Pyrinomonadaceae bacterium]|nr:caspase family protein [Pyrinomonadaceae bacterium]